MDENLRNSIALFRYGIIAPLVTKGETTPAMRGQFFRDASQKSYMSPDGFHSVISISILKTRGRELCKVSTSLPV